MDNARIVPPQDDLYVRAQLALWAGDASYAEELLKKIPLLDGTRVLSAPDADLAASAKRTLNQLRRRRAEFLRALRATNPRSSEHKLQNDSLVSQGGRLRAMTWRHDVREFEVRVFLDDLSWEQKFYAQVGVKALAGGATQNVPFYGNQPELIDPTLPEMPELSEYLLLESVDQKQPDESPEALPEYDLQWIVDDTMLMLAKASEFCTIEVRAIWSRHELPKHESEVRAIVQRFIDGIDPTEGAIDSTKPVLPHEVI